MKKTLLMLLLALCTVGAGYAQDKHVKVTGHVTDFETSEPVGMATIQLFTLPDSTFLQGATTDLKGDFEIDGRLKIGKYMLKASFVGYGDEVRN